jgi:hypothetical protein
LLGTAPERYFCDAQLWSGTVKISDINLDGSITADLSGNDDFVRSLTAGGNPTQPQHPTTPI